MDKIYIHKGDSTIFADVKKFLTFNLNTDLDLTDWTAKFILGYITKEITNISSKSFEVILTSEETSKLKYGSANGAVILVDSEGNTKTVVNTIPFEITNKVVENEYQEIDLTIPESSGVDITLKVGSGYVTSINGKSGKVNLTAEDIGALPDSTIIPDVSDLATKEELATKQDELTAGENIVIEGNVISAAGGGDVDAYTKSETDKLLAGKQDVLTPTAPINIGTTTIGEPKNIDTTQGYINPIYYDDNAIQPAGVNASSGCQLRTYGISSEYPSTWAEMFDRDSVSYFDIPVNFADEIQKVQKGEKSSSGLLLKIDKPNYINAQSAYLLIAGNLSDDGFDPITASMFKPGDTAPNAAGTAFLTGGVKNLGYRVLQLVSDGTGSTSPTSGTSSNLMTGIFLGIGYSNTLASIRAQYNSSSTAFRATGCSKSVTEAVTSRLSSINVLRVIVYPGATVGTGYLPTVEGTKLYIIDSIPRAGDDSTATDWNINSGAVTTYGISLNYDESRLKVVDGKLTVDLTDILTRLTALEG